jgi:tRNA(fMet)-specific endonuclease VapC
MNGKLLDTNIIVKVINGNEEYARVLDNLEADNVFIPVIVYGELMYGVEKSSKKDLNKKLFSEFCSDYHLILIDTSSAEYYGLIKNSLKNKGINIPENDIWIAAIAMSNNYELISGDGHFESIEGLRFRKV